MESNALWKDNVQSKIKSYAGTNYVSPRCRPVSSLGYVEAKNRTAASLKGANKQTYLSPHLEECVCACGSERKVAVLVSTDPRWCLIQTTGKILIWARISLSRTQPSAASTSGGRFSISSKPQKNIKTIHDH